ncbi:unnamed protein product [Protopolystoma xenopodis]|uniref:Uncharacterized protein n=1 Tax=Protopolystoma xenopodis TaxID=117903 RepID=A0A3S5B742_9PLAT|nr:unnamed protein product [Protopolystoma xenopodis]
MRQRWRFLWRQPSLANLDRHWRAHEPAVFEVQKTDLRWVRIRSERSVKSL